MSKEKVEKDLTIRLGYEYSRLEAMPAEPAQGHGAAFMGGLSFRFPRQKLFIEAGAALNIAKARDLGITTFASQIRAGYDRKNPLNKTRFSIYALISPAGLLNKNRDEDSKNQFLAAVGGGASWGNKVFRIFTEGMATFPVGGDQTRRAGASVVAGLLISLEWVKDPYGERCIPGVSEAYDNYFKAYFRLSEATSKYHQACGKIWKEILSPPSDQFGNASMCVRKETYESWAAYYNQRADGYAILAAQCKTLKKQ